MQIYMGGGSTSSGRGDLRPATISTTPSASVSLLLDILASKLGVWVTHLVVFVALVALEDFVDCFAPSAVTAGPMAGVAVGFGF